MRRSREISSNRIVKLALDMSKPTREWAEVLAKHYSLRSDELRSTIIRLRDVRMGQRKFCSRIRQQFRFIADEQHRAMFLSWLDSAMQDIEARNSESDEESRI